MRELLHVGGQVRGVDVASASRRRQRRARVEDSGHDRVSARQDGLLHLQRLVRGLHGEGGAEHAQDQARVHVQGQRRLHRPGPGLGP